LFVRVSYFGSVKTIDQTTDPVDYFGTRRYMCWETYMLGNMKYVGRMPCRSERLAKYNQLLRIEEELGSKVPACYMLAI
jgi:Enolase, C-terminal TIM barrel domain